MLATVVGSIVRELLKRLPPDVIKEVVDTMLDKIEEKVESTSTQLDDAVVLPLIGLIRDTLDIEDKKYGTDKS